MTPTTSEPGRNRSFGTNQQWVSPLSSVSLIKPQQQKKRRRQRSDSYSSFFYSSSGNSNNSRSNCFSLLLLLQREMGTDETKEESAWKRHRTASLFLSSPPLPFSFLSSFLHCFVSYHLTYTSYRIVYENIKFYRDICANNQCTLLQIRTILSVYFNSYP